MKNWISLLLVLLLTGSLFAQKKAFAIEDLYKIKSVGVPVISNDGNKIAFTVTSYDLPNSYSNTDIYVQDLKTKEISQFTSDSSADYNPVWINDDSGLYFLSARTGTPQLFYKSLSAGEEKQITAFYSGIDSPKLSPDGGKIIFTAQVFPECGSDEDCNKKITEAMDNGPIQAHIADSLFVRHWTEYNDGKYSHIFLYDIEKKNYTDLTPGFFNSPTFSAGGSDDYNFSPDSKFVVFSSKRVNDPEVSTNSDIYITSLDGNNAENLTGDNKAYDGHGVYSPDGKYIAYTKQSIPGYESDRIMLAVYNTKTKQHKTLTASVDNWVNGFEWSSDSKSIYFDIDEKGYNPVLKVELESGNISRVLEEKSLSGFAVSKDQTKLIYAYSFVYKPTEIALYNLTTGISEDITFFNREIAQKIDIRPAEVIWVDGADGKKIQVFVVKPHDFDPNKKYPFVINVHGGPQMQWRDSFRGDWQIYPGSGYVLAFPNPHGSTGFGQDFTHDISGGWDGNVFTDVMKVTDFMSNQPYIDKNRMGAMGWSYGGYFMNLLQAKKNPFKCLASMMGIFDVEDFYFETEELWFPNYDVKGDPFTKKEYYKKVSPSSYVDNFETPTLIITGEKDYRISYTQSLRYFSVLQKKGIDSRLIIFDNDGHWPSHLKSMPLYYNSHLEWFHKYLGGDKAPYDSRKLVRNLVF
ncbi:MAG: peptidase S9 [Ignavibacteriae bacterium HGW-Ignavibacteriae-2]|jgi:dipeptidyl aminopeptidase/acylaminoacyl peptidase|nr:MAG: peptidase S9 [Ignavibacteriae bacterium HGW-Ignavibacteriae-2]